MQKNIVAKIVLALLAIALTGFVLYKCGSNFKEGLEDAKEHREGNNIKSAKATKTLLDITSKRN